MILLATFIIPAIIAIATGLRGYKARPRTAGEFFWNAMWALLFGAAFIFAWHLAWFGAVSMAAGAGDGLVAGVIFNTGVSALIWFPCLMISYTFNAQRGLNDDR